MSHRKTSISLQRKLRIRPSAWRVAAATLALGTQAAVSADLTPPPPATMPPAEVLFYQGYDLLKLKTAQFANDKFPEEEKRGWQLIEQAAAQGNAKALRGMGA